MRLEIMGTGSVHTAERECHLTNGDGIHGTGNIKQFRNWEQYSYRAGGEMTTLVSNKIKSRKENPIFIISKVYSHYRRLYLGGKNER